MTLLATSLPIRFAIRDHRSHFYTWSLGWRTNGLSQGATLKTGLASVVAGISDAHYATKVEWVVAEGAECVTFAMPSHIRPSWGGLLDAADALGLAQPVISVVGDTDLALGHDGFHIEREAPALGEVPVMSSLRQSAAQGYEQMLVTGADPSAQHGYIETFLALSLLSAGPGALIPALVERENLSVMMQLSRTLHGGVPAITWQIVGPKGSVPPLISATFDAVADFRLSEQQDDFVQAKQFARANLARVWRNPFELARSLTQYEVMGWGGHLIADPDAALAHVAPDGVERAVRALMKPIADVVGREWP